MTQRTVAAVGLLLSSTLLLAACSGPEARMGRHLERGQKYFAEQNYDKARIEISNALQIDPNNVQARVVAGQIAEKQFKLRDAIGNFQAAIDADSGNIEARAALGRIYLVGGLPDKAKETIEPALVKAPGDARLLTVRGGIRAVQGDTAGALADAEAAVKAAPNDEVALALLAAQYRRAGQVEQAIATLQKAVEHNPDTVDLRLILAEIQYQADHKAEAETQLRTIADRHRETLNNWQQLARFYLLEKNPAGAEAALRSAIKYNPQSIEAKTALIGLLATQKGVDAATAQMLEFVKAEPKRPELKVALGQFYQASKKYAEAETVYREVMASDGVKARGLEARDRLATMLVQKPDLPAAEKLIAEVLAESPRDNDALILRASIAMARNETAAAITDLRAVLRDQPNSQPLMRTLARAHLQDNDTALAEEVLRNAVQINPTDQQSRFELASVLLATHRDTLAMPMLEALSKEAPDNIPVREAMYRALTAQGDMEGARRSAEEVKRLRPDIPQGYLLSAALLEHERKFAAARAEYEVAMQKSPTPEEILPALVRVDLSEKQPQKAAARLTEFLEKQPADAIANQLLGEVRLSQSDPAAALASFDRAIAAKPKWWLPWRGKAAAQDAAKHPELAMQALSEGMASTGAIELGMDLATRQETSGQHDAAIKTYEDMMLRLPRSLPVANNLALMLVNRRSDAASLAEAAKLTEILVSSSDAPFLDTRGWVKFRRGEIQQALPLLQQAAEKAPQSVEILYHLGMAQFRNGDRNGARQSLEAAVRPNARYAGIDEARATLAALRSSG